MGGYQTLIMVIVIALVIILNLVVNKLDFKVDLSSDKKYSLTDESIEYVKKIQDKITFYYMCEEGAQNVAIDKVVHQYDGLGNIKVVDKDPVLYPSFSKQFIDEEVANNDVIVVDETTKNNRLVKASDMLIEDPYAQYTGGTMQTLDAEGQLSASLGQVMGANTKTLYYLSGHDEVALSTSFSEVALKSNINCKELASNDLQAKGVSEDCDILVINGPSYDLSEEEAKKVSEYLANGGKALFTLNAAATDDTKHLNKLISDYGVDVQDGYIIDTKYALDPTNAPTIFMSEPKEHEIISSDIKGQFISLVSKGMKVQEDVRSTLKVSPLYLSSAQSYSKVNKEAKTPQKENGDIDGPFNVALAMEDTYAEKKLGSGHATKILVFGSYGDFDNSLISTNQYANREILINSLTYLCGGENQTLAIPQRALDAESVVIKQSDRVFFTVLLVVVVPLIFLACGFVIWFKRRKN